VFEALGGPGTDPFGLDPDGDGRACGSGDVTPTPTPTAGPTGLVYVQITAENGTTPIRGACIELHGPDTYPACDNGEADFNPKAGVIEIDAVGAGEYAISVEPPPGYVEVVPGRRTIVPAGEVVRLVIVLERAETTPTS
jgi:hypothetical protein